MPKIPLVEDLTRGLIPPGSRFLVEYDSAADWYNASVTIAAGWLRSGGRVAYNVASQPPKNNIRLQLTRLGLEPQELEESGLFRVYDWHSASLGRKSTEKMKEDSLKVTDMSIGWMKEAKELTQSAPAPGGLMIVDDISSLDRFNEEKSWVEFVLTRVIARDLVRPSPCITMIGVIKGLHSERVYKRLEATFDGIIDLKLDELGEETRNIMRIRSSRNIAFDSRWHQLNVDENFEVTLKK